MMALEEKVFNCFITIIEAALLAASGCPPGSS
jgi:hypothetical protein